MRRARKLGCDRIEMLVTSPGRQAANGRELVSRLAETTGVPTRVLTPEEEGELAWYGAVEALERTADLVAVCDVGGGSTQVAVGSDSGGPAWTRSFDLGSLRLTRRALGCGAGLTGGRRRSSSGGERRVRRADTAAGANGDRDRRNSTRASQGCRDDTRRGEPVVSRAQARQALDVAREETYGVEQARAQTLTAGTLILVEVQSRLGVPLEIGRGGLREGAALSRSTSWPKRSARSGAARRACPRRRARALHLSSAKRRRGVAEPAVNAEGGLLSDEGTHELGAGFALLLLR